jgi:hypothetical protein
MRRIILTTALIALAPLAYPQPMPPSGSMSAPPGAMNTGGSGTVVSNWTTRPPDPGNCGTPDEPRPCPPKPRNPLPYFPENRR